jgi:hypothetical protein
LRKGKGIAGLQERNEKTARDIAELKIDDAV